MWRPISFQTLILIPINFSEREKLTEREQLWRQLEELAKNNPVWEKMIGQMERIDLASKVTDDYLLDGEELKIENIDQLSREVYYKY